MSKPLDISLLKFASCLCNNKDVRSFCKVVFVEHNQGNTVIYSTNGHLAIRIVIPNQTILLVGDVTLDSINNAYKTGLNGLLNVDVDNPVRRPPLERIFVEPKYIEGKVGFDVKYLALITSNLVKLTKDLGTKQSGVVIHTTSPNKANYLECNLDLHNEEIIKIMVAIMPMKL